MNKVQPIIQSMRKTTNSWLHALGEPCGWCDTRGYHSCVECGVKISQEQCENSEGHCKEHDEAYSFNFG